MDPRKVGARMEFQDSKCSGTIRAASDTTTNRSLEQLSLKRFDDGIEPNGPPRQLKVKCIPERCETRWEWEQKIHFSSAGWSTGCDSNGRAKRLDLRKVGAHMEFQDSTDLKASQTGSLRKKSLVRYQNTAKMRLNAQRP